jgi:hypothetical protein
MMKKLSSVSLAVLALAAVSIPAYAQTSDASVEFAFMPRTMTVTLLNEGGKYVAVDLKHIAKGESCRMDKDATIARVGEGERGMVRVRYAAAQISSGGCPFMTTFYIPAADYAQARAEVQCNAVAQHDVVDDVGHQREFAEASAGIGRRGQLAVSGQRLGLVEAVVPITTFEFDAPVIGEGVTEAGEADPAGPFARASRDDGPLARLAIPAMTMNAEASMIAEKK